jgi:hypothetical protein
MLLLFVKKYCRTNLKKLIFVAVRLAVRFKSEEYSEYFKIASHYFLTLSAIGFRRGKKIPGCAPDKNCNG